MCVCVCMCVLPLRGNLKNYTKRHSKTLKINQNVTLENVPVTHRKAGKNKIKQMKNMRNRKKKKGRLKSNISIITLIVSGLLTLNVNGLTTPIKTGIGRVD